MTSREIIRRLVSHNEPPRFGMDFSTVSDFTGARIMKPLFRYKPEYADWGRHPELLNRLDNFAGEVRFNEFGDIYGRLRGETSGECVLGCLEEDWKILDDYTFPDYDPAHDGEVLKQDFKNSDKYAIGYMPFAIFSRFRDSRRLENALADTLLEPGRVRALMEKEKELLVKAVNKAADFGFDAIMFADDLGTQKALLLSPKSLTELFKPIYKAVADAAHNRGMKFFMHSCGMIYEAIPILIDAGIDVFQFDQPELYGSERLAKEFGNRVCFYSPVDIQKIMPTGDKKTIEDGALTMMNNFKKHCGGGLIINDYGSWKDLHVSEEWAEWARQTVIANAAL